MTTIGRILYTCLFHPPIRRPRSEFSVNDRNDRMASIRSQAVVAVPRACAAAVRLGTDRNKQGR